MVRPHTPSDTGSPDARDHVVRVVLDIDDALKSDNQFVIPIRGDDHINTLLVNGEPSTVAYRDEMFFFERALNPKKDSQQSKVVLSPQRVRDGRRALDEFDVVVLANVSHIGANTAAKLKKFVEQGGGLLITMGSQVDTTAYNLHMSEVMPKALRGLKQLATPDDPDAPVKITAFGTMNHNIRYLRCLNCPAVTRFNTGRCSATCSWNPTLTRPPKPCSP